MTSARSRIVGPGNAVEVVIRPHIAIRDDGDADRAAHFADFFPVRMAAVKLLARAAVHRDGIDACRLGAFRQVHDVDGALVPADPHLDRKRHLHRLADGRENGRRVLRVAHERRALAILDDFRRGTAHVEIEDVGRAELFDIGRRLGRHLWASRENLHGERPLGGLGRQHRERALVLEMDALARHHFGIAERTAHVVRDDAAIGARKTGASNEKGPSFMRSPPAPFPLSPCSAPFFRCARDAFPRCAHRAPAGPRASGNDRPCQSYAIPLQSCAQSRPSR